MRESPASHPVASDRPPVSQSDDATQTQTHTDRPARATRREYVATHLSNIRQSVPRSAVDSLEGFIEGRLKR